MRGKTRTRLRRRAALAGVLGAAALYLGPGLITDAHAEVTDNGLNCTGSIAGTAASTVDSENVDDAIKVGENQNIFITATADTKISYTVDLAFAFRGWEVADGQGDNSWANTVKVSDYSRFGAGLYRVTAHMVGLGGGSCDMAALVDVTKDPIPGTLAGDAAGALSVISALGVGGSAIKAGAGGSDGGDGGGGDGGGGGGGTPPREIPVGLLPPDDDWCYPGFVIAVLMTLGFMTGVMATGGGPGGGAVPARRLPRARWRPRFALLGIISGIVGSLSGTVLLQQYGKVFPTLRVVITAVVVGLVVSIALPSLVRVFTVWRWNRRMDALERQMAR